MAKENIALSVIIPVYNAEKTIREALDSLLQQSLKEIEIICVDDGSKDRSVEIITEYAEKDGRVRLLRQQNRYAGIARNTGMDAARGEYLFFLDSDDYVMNYALEAALNKCRKYRLDCLRFRSFTLDEGTGRYIRYARNDFSRLIPEDYNKLLTLKAGSPLLRISVAPWSGMCRRAFVQEHQCRFNGLRCVNDRSFYSQVITAGGRYMCAQDRVTVHRINQSDSLIGRKADHFDCQIESLRITESQMKASGVPPETAELIMREDYHDLLVWYERYMGDPDRRKEMDEKIRIYTEDGSTAYSDLLRSMTAEREAGETFPAETETEHPLHEACADPLVTVIVPVENGEDVLNRTLESLTNQTLEEMEFLLADAGSKDHSMTILMEYRERDKRFRITARGAEEAKGQYICILEQGDQAESGYYEKLYRKAAGKARFRYETVSSACLKAHPESYEKMKNRKRTASYRMKQTLAWLPGKAKTAFRLAKGYGLKGIWRYAVKGEREL